MENSNDSDAETLEFKDAVYVDDSTIDCEVNDADYGWISTTVTKEDNPKLYAEIKKAGNIKAYTPPNHDVQLRDAFEQVNNFFSRLLSELTGNISSEERTSWPSQQAAAEAHKNNNLLPHHTAMLGGLANARGISIEDIVVRIIAKITAYSTLYGIADDLRKKAKISIVKIIDASNPIEKVELELSKLFEQMRKTVDKKITEWKSTNA